MGLGSSNKIPVPQLSLSLSLLPSITAWQRGDTCKFATILQLLSPDPFESSKGRETAVQDAAESHMCCYRGMPRIADAHSGFCLQRIALVATSPDER